MYNFLQSDVTITDSSFTTSKEYYGPKTSYYLSEPNAFSGTMEIIKMLPFTSSVYQKFIILL